MKRTGFAIFPLEVLGDPDLSDRDKVLYAQISALRNLKGYCWATNQKLSELVGGCSVQTIQRAIKSLVDKGYVKSTIVITKPTEGAGRYERRLSIVIDSKHFLDPEPTESSEETPEQLNYDDIHDSDDLDQHKVTAGVNNARVPPKNHSDVLASDEKRGYIKNDMGGYIKNDMGGYIKNDIYNNININNINSIKPLKKELRDSYNNKPSIIDYLDHKGIKWREPFHCLMPDHEDIHPSMALDTKTWRVKCFSCGYQGDIYDLRRDLDGENQTNASYSGKFSDQQFLEESWLSAELLEDGEKIFRGLNREIREKYKLGFTANYQFDDLRSDALVIPVGPESITIRNAKLNVDPRYRYRKRGKLQPFLPPESLEHREIVLVEGEIDCLSLIQLGVPAIALGSTQNYKKFIDWAGSQSENFGRYQTILLCLDGDDAGRRVSRTIWHELNHLGITVKEYDAPWRLQYWDANEYLLATLQQPENLFASESVEEVEYATSS